MLVFPVSTSDDVYGNVTEMYECTLHGVVVRLSRCLCWPSLSLPTHFHLCVGYMDVCMCTRERMNVVDDLSPKHIREILNNLAHRIISLWPLPVLF